MQALNFSISLIFSLYFSFVLFSHIDLSYFIDFCLRRFPIFRVIFYADAYCLNESTISLFRNKIPNYIFLAANLRTLNLQCAVVCFCPPCYMAQVVENGRKKHAWGVNKENKPAAPLPPNPPNPKNEDFPAQKPAWGKPQVQPAAPKQQVPTVPSQQMQPTAPKQQVQPATSKQVQQIGRPAIGKSPFQEYPHNINFLSAQSPLIP